MQQALLDAAHSNEKCFNTFQKHLVSIRGLLKQIKPTSSQMTQAFYRMTYASVITAIETYLADTFYRMVISDQDLTEKLLTTAPEFLERKYSMSEILDWQRNVVTRIGEFLQGIAWHNLGKVRPMYEVTLGVEFPSEFGELCKAVAIRHDIVHRNGRNKEHRMHRFSEQDLVELASMAENFVRQIETQVALERRATVQTSPNRWTPEA